MTSENTNGHIRLRFYNSATRDKELFTPLHPGEVYMYTCGPTIYNFAHIGNFRTYVFEDLLRRTIKFFGFKIIQAMNLTDVDDKTIRGAIAQQISLEEYTLPYKKAFFEDLHTLNIEPVEYYPAATDYIPAMIKMVQVLLEKGFAYRGGDDSIYYAIHKFPRYGCLSHLHLNELQAGASTRVLNDEYDKDNISDFVLWKAYDSERDGQIYWDSPFGPGRPGWHIECSAMAMQLLGDTIDIHVGGIDNLFPHHENEIAQSEACSNKPFAKIWMHAEHLVVDQRKMSKSLGNFYTLRDLLHKGYTGEQVRYLLLQTHYKTQLNFTFQGLEAAKSTLQRLNDFVQRISDITTLVDGEIATGFIQTTLQAFTEALADDLNISAALATLFDFVREINVLCDQEQISHREAQLVLKFMQKINSVLGVIAFDRQEAVIPDELQIAFEQRQIARKAKNWQLADELRQFIQERGYLIEDTLHGARLKPIIHVIKPEETTYD